jgi:hypothetical protein
MTQMSSTADFTDRSSRTVLIVFGAVFLFVTTWFSWQWKTAHLNSPDETANAFFIESFATTGSLRVQEPLNAIAQNSIHPRSTNVIEGDLVPGGFLGIILLYGWVARFFGVWIVSLLTPLLALAGAYGFFLIIKAVFNVRTAGWSTLLLLAHPAWISYTARGLFPNVPFLALALIGFATLLPWWMSTLEGERSWWRAGLAGLALGVAISIRPTEFVWVALVCCAGTWFGRKRLRWGDVGIFLIGAVLPVATLLSVQLSVYGHPFATGYAQLQSEGAVFAAGTPSNSMIGLWAQLLFAPFGIVLWRIGESAFAYLVTFFWWFTIPVTLGIALLLKRWSLIAGSHRVYSVLTVAVTGLLLVYYGSWDINDTTLSGATLGTSFVRYWLPVYLFTIPFVVLAIHFLTSRIRRISAPVVYMLFVIGSISFTLVAQAEGLQTIAAALHNNAEVRAQVVTETEQDAVVLTEDADKIIFPERKVIAREAIGETELFHVLQSLREVGTDVYYLTTLEGSHIAFLNKKMQTQGIAWYELSRIEPYILHRLETTK